MPAAFSMSSTWSEGFRGWVPKTKPCAEGSDIAWGSPSIESHSKAESAIMPAGVGSPNQWRPVTLTLETAPGSSCCPTKPAPSAVRSENSSSTTGPSTVACSLTRSPELPTASSRPSNSRETPAASPGRFETLAR